MRDKVTVVYLGPFRLRVRRGLLTLTALIVTAGALYGIARGYL